MSDMPGPWEARAHDLADDRDWDDDLDIVDATERREANAHLSGAVDTFDHPTAVEVVNTPRTKWVNPYETLLDEVRRSHAYVIMLEEQVRHYDAQGGAHHSRAGQRVLRRWEGERDRSIAASKTAISLGISEKLVRLMQSDGEELARIAVAAVDRLNLAPELRRRLLAELAVEFRTRQTRALAEARAATA